MSGPVVVIGFILLIPSVLGMLASALALLGMISFGAAESSRARDEATLKMRNAGVPESIIAYVLADKMTDVNSQLASQGRIITTALEQVRSNVAIQVDAREKMLQAGIPNPIIRAVSTEGRLTACGKSPAVAK